MIIIPVLIDSVLSVLFSLLPNHRIRNPSRRQNYFIQAKLFHTDGKTISYLKLTSLSDIMMKNFEVLIMLIIFSTTTTTA
jgi:hypothetical protein